VRNPLISLMLLANTFALVEQYSQQSQSLSFLHTNALLQYTIHGRWSVLFVEAFDVHGSWAKEGHADRFSPVSGPWRPGWPPPFSIYSEIPQIYTA
jgi:hypothetical protein